MKTRENLLRKVLFMTLLLPALMVGCGKDNKSGGGSNNNNDPWAGQNFGGGNTTVQLPSDWLTRLYNEYPCQINNGNGTNNNNRVRIAVQSPNAFQVNVGNLHAGVTVEGDILVITNNNNRVTAEVHACQRPELLNQAQLIKEPVLNISQTCAMGEVTAADITLNSNYGQYVLLFFPAGLSGPTTLCNSSNINYNNQYNYGPYFY